VAISSHSIIILLTMYDTQKVIRTEKAHIMNMFVIVIIWYSESCVMHHYDPRPTF